MLSSLRRGGFVQFVMGGIVCLIIAGFALTYMGRRGTSVSLKQDCVVTLGSDCVPAKDFTSSFRLAVPPYLEEKDIKAQGFRRQVIDGLIERELLVREADRLGVSISDDDVDGELELGRVHYSLPVGSHALEMNRRFEAEANPMLTYLPVHNQQTDSFDFKVYKRAVLNYTRMSTKDFKAKQREELIASRMRALIMSTVRVAEAEAFAQYQRDNSKAIARIVNLDREWFARFAAATDENAVASFAKENQDKINTAWDEKKASYTAGCADISEIDLAYDSSATDQERADAKKKLDAARKRIQAGDSFDLVARLLSTGKSAALGGRVGCSAPGQDADSEKLAQAVAKLNPGELSDVIETDSGVRLIKLEAKLADNAVESEGKKLLTRELALGDAADKQARKYAEALIEQGKNGKSLEDLTAELNKKFASSSGDSGESAKKLLLAALSANNRPKVEISSSFAIAENPVPGAVDGSPAALIFGLEKADDLYAEPIATTQGFAVLQLKEKTPALREDFDKKKDQLMAELRLRKQADALASYVHRLRTEAESKIKIDNRYLDEASSKSTDEG